MYFESFVIGTLIFIVFILLMIVAQQRIIDCATGRAFRFTNEMLIGLISVHL